MFILDAIFLVYLFSIFQEDVGLWIHLNVFILVSLFKYTGVLIVAQAKYRCGLFCLKKLSSHYCYFSFFFA